MLLKRHSRKDDGVYPLHGWAKFFHRLGRFILFPLRRPIITLLIILVLFLAPTFRGVKPISVHKWYATQIVSLYNKVLVWWGSRQPEVTPGEFKFHPEEAAPAPVTPSEFTVPELQDDNAPNILEVLRGEQPTEETKEEAQEKPQEPEKSKAEEKTVHPSDFIPDETEVVFPAGTRMPENEKLYAYPQDKKVALLKYVDYPHEVYGIAKVHDSNEIEINGQYIMLYGIYVHPMTARGVSATQYLKDKIDGKEIKCGIIAYTDQDIATGICYDEDVNLNIDLITKGYTKNVAL
ncbi:MAG: hypothetical protein IJ660_05575 [Alphaproteobacteria bacterium]|nr:hypothetical protein [Alphaproteobacteria bacterium]